jgi:hypothetical protein
VEEFTPLLWRALAQKEMVAGADAQDDDNNNNRTSIVCLVIWVSAVEIWRR